MMNSDDYRNTMKYPRREDYAEVVIVTSSKGARQEVKFFDQEEYNKARDAYLAENTRLWNLFIADLKKELGITYHPKADLLISKAIDHSGGDIRSMIDWCEEMVDLII